MLRRHRHHRHHAPPTGGSPDVAPTPAETRNYLGDGPRPTVRVMKYGGRELTEETLADAGRVRELLDESSVTWVHVDGVGHAGTLEELGQIFGLHPLALEDVVNVRQRAKVEEYGDHLFIVVRTVALEEADVLSEQLSLFLGERFVLSFQEGASACLEPVRERIRKSRGRVRRSGADYLAYAIIDAVVDAYFPVVDEFGERIEVLDEQITAGKSPRFMESLHDIRIGLTTLRRALRPLRDALVLLMPDPHALIKEETQYHLRDVYDHTVQLMELLDTYRETCSDLRDYYMSIVNIRMNEVMKVLTIISTIFIPLSFIASIYGMNFHTDLPGNMPELEMPYGYVYVWIVMLAVGLGLLTYIWRRGWLSSDDGDLARPASGRPPADDR